MVLLQQIIKCAPSASSCIPEQWVFRLYQNPDSHAALCIHRSTNAERNPFILDCCTVTLLVWQQNGHLAC